MFTDIVGYTALMAESEANALRARARHRDLVRPFVDRYHGESIEARGDESLSVFPSALDAVNCALAIEAELQGQELRLHIGIHLGDLVIEAGEVSGDGVNIASRICSLSEGGGLCVSDEVYQAVRNQPDIQVTPLGERELKNVGRPVPVFALRGPAAPPSTFVRERGPVRIWAALAVAAALILVLAWWFQAVDDPMEAIERRPAVAVLPFENPSGDPVESLFADGLADDLILRLAGWRSFPVVARVSSFNPGLPADVQEAGRALGARYVVSGSVRRGGDRIRINVSLIDTESSRSIWNQTYDRDFSDSLALQNEISRKIVGEVFPDLLQFESERAMHQDPDNLDAWTTAMQGWWHFNQGRQANIAQARELFARAVELDPRFGYAYAGLALANYRTLVGGWTDSPEQTSAEMLAAAETAVALDEFGAEAHHALGHAFAMTGQTDRMIGAFREGAELNPNDAMANNCYGAHLAWVGRSEEAIERLNRAMSISPRDPWAFEFRVSMAWAFFAAEDYEHALEWADRAIQRGPNWRAYQVAAASLAYLGHPERARTALRELLRLQPNLTVEGIELFFAPADADFRDRLIGGLRKAGWQA
jgi:adenylate cyclase